MESVSTPTVSSSFENEDADAAILKNVFNMEEDFVSSFHFF